jgi:hypothetical protein
MTLCSFKSRLVKWKEQLSKILGGKYYEIHKLKIC